MRSSRIGAFGSHTVSPVVASLRPAAATISPATRLLEALALVGVDAEQARDLLLLVRCGRSAPRRRPRSSREHAHEHDLAALVHRDLERERGERLVVLRRARELLARVARIDARAPAARRPATAGTRSPRRAAGGCPCCAAPCRASTGTIFTAIVALRIAASSSAARELLAVEVLLGDRVVEIGERLDHLIARIGGGRRACSSGIVDRRSGASMTSPENMYAFIVDEIDHAGNASSLPIGSWIGDRVGAEPIADVGDHASRTTRRRGRAC